MRITCIIIFIFFGNILFAQTSEVTIKPRMRVIIDNDFSGDPDGLFALVHHLLSPSVEIRAIIGSHLPAGSGGFGGPQDSTATYAAKKVEEVLHIMNLNEKYPVYAGSNKALINNNTPQKTAAAQAIVDEAMRTDTKLPLYVVCGAGLTDLASAYLLNPEIAGKLTLIWIGGPEYEGIALPPPVNNIPEYNLGIDLKATQVIFNKSAIPMWQVPRSTYRQVIIPYSSLLLHVKTEGATGKYLMAAVENIMQAMLKFNVDANSETYVLGDSPLVLLTALQSFFEPDPASSNYILKTAPIINDKGLYETNNSGKKIRVYTQVDVNLLYTDMVSKLTLFNQHQ